MFKNNILKNFLFTIFILIFLFLLIEAGFRGYDFIDRNKKSGGKISFSEDPPDIYVNDAFTGYKFRPNLNLLFHGETLKTNRDGFREEDLDKKRDGETRIAFVGDSFTFGWNVESYETFSEQTEKILNGEGNEQLITSVNFGIPGFGTDQELAVFEKYLPSYEPDIVILCFFMGNDITDNIIGGVKRKEVKDGYLFDNYLAGIKRGNMKTSDKFLEFVSRYSSFFSFIRKRYELLKLKLGSRKAVNPYYILEVKQLDIFKKNYEPVTERGIKLTQDIFLKFKEKCKTKNYRFAIMIIPAYYQLFPLSWQNYLKTFGLSKDDYDALKPNRVLSDFLSNNDIPFIDMTERFNGLSKEGKWDIFYEGHWNKKGNRLAAGFLADFIRDTFPLSNVKS